MGTYDPRAVDGLRFFESMLDQLRQQGVELMTRSDHPLVESLEQSIREARRVGGLITLWENRWAQRNLIDENPGPVSERSQRLTLQHAIGAALKTCQMQQPTVFFVSNASRATPRGSPGRPRVSVASAGVSAGHAAPGASGSCFGATKHHLSSHENELAAGQR